MSATTDQDAADGAEEVLFKGTQRPDGTWRKDVKVRKGWVPEPIEGDGETKKKQPGKERSIKFVAEKGGKGGDDDGDDNEDDDDDDNDSSSEDGDFEAGDSGSDDEEEDSDESDESSDEDSNDDPFSKLSEEVEGEHLVAFASTLASNLYNEDRFYVDEKHRLFGVFDGHGGRDCADFCSQELSAEFAARYTAPAGKAAAMDGLEEMFFSGAAGGEDKDKSARVAETRAALKATFQAVDTRFLEAHGAANPTCGSCALLCLLEGGALYAAIVGDSRAILVRRGAKGAVSGLPLTVDQNTSHAGECAKVVARSGDKEAIRYNESEARGMRREAIKRVGGTLMVTRALGDGYLKAAAYSMPPFNRALPYITSKPKVTRVELDAASDAFVVVASDGVWEHMSNDEVAAEVVRIADGEAEHGRPAKEGKPGKGKGKERREKGETRDNMATSLIDEVVRLAARKQCMPAAELRSMRPGGPRRGYIDDLTVVIVPLGAAIGAGKKRAAGAAEEERSVKRKEA